MPGNRLFPDFETNRFIGDRRRRQMELGRFVGVGTIDCKSQTATTTLALDFIQAGDWVLLQPVSPAAGVEAGSGNWWAENAAAEDGKIKFAHTNTVSASARTFFYMIVGAIS